MDSFSAGLLEADTSTVLRVIASVPHPPRLDDIHASLGYLQGLDVSITSVRQQYIYYIEFHPHLCKDADDRRRYIHCLLWIIKGQFDGNLSGDCLADGEVQKGSEVTKMGMLNIEIGPRLNFKTSFCTNALSIMTALGLPAIGRVERSKAYELRFSNSLDEQLTNTVKTQFLWRFMDSILECEYTASITSFVVDIPRQPVVEINVMNNGKQALVDANVKLSLGFDEEDLDYYTELFASKLKRNPTNVECLDLAQSNSEHSRHWFFNGALTVDGEKVAQSLFRMVKDTQKRSNPNNVIKFSDNSSAIEGFKISVFKTGDPTKPSAFSATSGTRHIIFTAETHNFPTAVEPFSGATTGTGGRIRDVHATGRGSYVIAGTAGYSFGNCHIPGYSAEWENDDDEYPKSFAHPLKVIIEASNGASDYGNKFGEPVVCGYARSFGSRLPNGERREWIKPIMFSGGIGSIDSQWITKDKPTPGMDVVKIGGPVYRIGVGGGAASSTVVQGSNDAAVDFNAVQRGDAEMEQKLNRVIRGCIELEDNPIVSIHDQGAGGNANVLKEIVDPAGAVIRADNFSLGDNTLSIHELWVAEYQESVAVLVPKAKVEVVQDIARRERCPVDVVGEITGTGKIILEDFGHTNMGYDAGSVTPVDLPLDLVLGNVPAKKYDLQRVPTSSSANPADSKLANSDVQNMAASFRTSLHQILRLPSVASKRYLTNKVDRSVTGLIAQQQCVGPFHTPLADVAVIALSPFDLAGGATSVGEQPIKMMFDVKRGARLSVVEALTNLVFAKISSLKDVKCSGNWMWPAKLPGEGAALYDACEAMCSVMGELGIAVDGGKDSLSMAAKCGDEVVKSPGTLVISAYAPCPDIRRKVTPDLKVPNGQGVLLWVDLSHGKHRLQGSAYAQVKNDFSSFIEVPDLESAEEFVTAFEIIQKLIQEGRITAGHDISDGGLIVCLLEMAIAGNAVFDVSIPVGREFEQHAESCLFSEEVGWILEAAAVDKATVLSSFEKAGIPCHLLGQSLKQLKDTRELAGEMVYAPFVHVNGNLVYGADSLGINGIRTIWEEFSYQIERLQADPVCADSQKSYLAAGTEPTFIVNFAPELETVTMRPFADITPRNHRVAIVREEGSNGDREMAAALYMAGFEVWEVNVQDMLDGKVDLNIFRGLIFVGGFSYADVFGSAKGWAAVLAFNTATRGHLEQFFQRDDTFSLGVCNGCQLLALLGIVGHADNDVAKIDLQNAHAILKHNKSGRFESRFSTVKIHKSSAIMLRGMEDSQLGIWVAHGEGMLEMKNGLDQLRARNCISLEYVDSTGQATEEYPENPNGSPGGIAGICSLNGRHLAMMPHPERTVLTWQWPWIPENLSWPKNAVLSPWMKMFSNAYNWCGA